MFPLIVIDRSRAEAIEPLGTKTKFWFTDVQGRRLLFKAEERGTGEDWAEKVACELAGLIGLPHVHYEMAIETESKTPGVVCQTMLEPGEMLRDGDLLLLKADPNYPIASNRFHTAAHTVGAVSEVVSAMKPPGAKWTAGMPSGVNSAMDGFAGYFMLDAWIANQDRHHQNWGAIQDAHGVLSLAPTFDHGASLARNISDNERHDRMTSKDQGRQIPKFARRSRSALYANASDERPLSTLAAFRAIANRAGAAAGVWLDRLREIEGSEIEDILRQIHPERLSAIGQKFTLYLLEENRRRLLEGEME